jgi:hypothetical protein
VSSVRVLEEAGEKISLKERREHNSEEICIMRSSHCCYTLAGYLAYSSTLKMEVALSYETSVNYLITWITCHPTALLIGSCENLRSTRNFTICVYFKYHYFDINMVDELGGARKSVWNTRNLKT